MELPHLQRAVIHMAEFDAVLTGDNIPDFPLTTLVPTAVKHSKEDRRPKPIHNTIEDGYRVAEVRAAQDVTPNDVSFVYAQCANVMIDFVMRDPNAA